jgi:hypothetical protein
MKYADPQDRAFPLEPASRTPIVHDILHRLYNGSRWGMPADAKTAPLGGVTAGYDGAKFAAVHAEAVRAMLAAGFQHRLRCDGSLDHSLPQELMDQSASPVGAVIDAQALLAASAGELAGTFHAQAAVAAKPAVEVPVPAELLGQVKEVDAQPYLVAGLIAKVGVKLPVVVPGADGKAERVEVLFTPEFLADLAGQIPVVQHPEHLDRERGAFARRPNVSYVLAAALTPDKQELWGVAWIPASSTELLAEVKAGLAVGKPPAWSIEGPVVLVRAGETVVPKPGSAKLISIDWVETGRPGVPGAGPAGVISAQKVLNSEEEPMTKEEREGVVLSLTAAELKAQRPDLVETIVSAQQDEGRVKKLEEENAGLKAKIAEHEQAQVSAQLDAHRQKLLGNVAEGPLRESADMMLSGQTVAELDANWPKVQERIAKLTAGMPVVGAGAEGGDKKPISGLNY